MSQDKGLLERVNVHIKEEEGEALKKSIDAQKALLDSIGTSSSAKTSTTSTPTPKHYR